MRFEKPSFPAVPLPRQPAHTTSFRATTRPPVPPVNLKDRIAALQQRNASSANHGSEAANSRLPGANSLKDKIANFERKGAVPVPKGRFGTSAPLAADGSTKKRGELYGNRVPELAKSTAEAVLLVRKRTVSTSDALRSRPTSPDIPPVPSLQYGSLEHRLPSSHVPATRRIVSDVLPRKSSTFESETLVQGEKEVDEVAVVVNEPETVSEVVAETESRFEDPLATVDTPLEDPPVSPPATEAVPSALITPSGAMDDEDISEPEKIRIEEIPHSDANSEATSSAPIDATTESAVLEPSTVDSLNATPFAGHSVDDVAAAIENLTVNTETDSSSLIEDSTASSESTLTTPSDNMSFATAESPADTQDKPLKDMSTPSSPVTAIPEVVAGVPSPVPSPAITPSFLRNSARQSVLSEMSVGGESLALDVREAVIVTEPPQIVSPTVTRAVIVPAPTSNSSTSSIPLPSPVSATEQVALERRITQKSFHSVVHHKVREVKTPEPVNPLPVPPKQPPSFPLPQTPTRQRVRATWSAEPQSPGFNDLVSLVADAALLEEQLTSSRSSTKVLPTPTLNIHPTISEVPELDTNVPRVTQSPHRLQPESSPSSTSSHSYQLAPMHARSRTTSEHPSTPPREGGRYFSSLRVRKKSMPGAYPRTSICSEVSADSSMLVSRPPSPPSYGQNSLNSDASSIRSSTKSWKSPKKGISRAGSWLFRGKSKNHVVMEGTFQSFHSFTSEFTNYGIRAGCAPGCL